MKALIVEDDRFYGALLAELLRDRGVDCHVVHSVEEALGVDPSDFTVVIADVMLPNDPAKSGITIEDTRAGFYAGIALCRMWRQRGVNTRMVLISAAIWGRSADAQNWAIENEIPFVSKMEGPKALVRVLEQLKVVGRPRAPRAFIVHGHDEKMLLELKDYIQNTLRWQEPIVLREQPSAGKTIIEKFEEAAPGIDCVFVLLTPDDTAVEPNTDDEKRRARQNVIFELGFFYSQLGRKTGRVFVLRKGPVELPTDIDGIVWIDVSNGIRRAGEDIRREISHLNECLQ